MDAHKLAAFDIPNRDNIHRYQCNNPIKLSLVGISKDLMTLASFDIPTRDNIHLYQCNNPILLNFFFQCNLNEAMLWVYNSYGARLSPSE